jgi:hypothetical protein
LGRRALWVPERLAKKVQDDENSHKARHHQQQRGQQRQQTHHDHDADGAAQVKPFTVADAEIHFRNVGSAGRAACSALRGGGGDLLHELRR